MFIQNAYCSNILVVESRALCFFSVYSYSAILSKIPTKETRKKIFNNIPRLGEGAIGKNNVEAKLYLFYKTWF